VLDVTFHAGVELDICPRCRGVWLDRGELERLLADPVPSPRDGRERGDDDRYDDRYDDRGRGGRDDRSRRKRRFADRLSDVFDDVLDF
jgi:Zn-finger nucleic acid-binding protein